MARPSLQAVGQNALGSFQRMTAPQRVTLGLAFAATAIGVFLLARATSAMPMTTLYANLDPDVAAEITAELDAQGVPYDLQAGGRVIQVPSADVHQVRLDLAAQDLPSGSGGWEVFENQGITASAFQEDVAYQRAMEGELAQTIASIDTVRSANVHLVMPESDLFAADDMHASASVLVDTGSQTLSAMQVQAVINLVASSIEGLTADQVSLVDGSGQVLAAPGGAGSSLDLEGDSRLRARLDYERSLETDLENLLANIVGPGLAMVTVAAELDFDAVTTTTEEHRPIESAEGDQLLINETTRNELYRTDLPAAEEGGELEIELPDDIDLDGDGELDEGVGEYILDERDANFAVDRVVTTSQNAPGAVTGLSVAVLLDEAEVDAARLGDIETLVGAAVGLNEERGDILAVQLLPINETVKTSIEESAVEPAVEAAGLDLVALIRTAGTVLIALIVVLLAIRNLARNPRRRVVEAVELSELEGGSAAELEAGETDEDDEDEDDEGEPEVAELAAGDEEEEEGEPPEARLQHLIANQTEDVAGVLRSWLNETEEVPI